MEPWSYLLTLGFLSLLIKGSLQGKLERGIYNKLFVDSNYTKHERPVEDDFDVVHVKFGIILQQIIDVDERSENIISSMWLRMDEKNQIIQTNIWKSLTWHAYNLQWDKEEFNNISQIVVPKELVWTPDILMYNSASDDFDETYPTNVIIKSDGEVLWVPPGMFKSTCTIDITWFPFDDQKCDLKFGSWTHTGMLLNLTQDNDEGDTSDFIRNGEWMLVGLPVTRHVLRYECCPETYIDLTYTIHIRRRTLYYGFNIIIPCVLISSLTLLLFILPPDAGEKISLGVTILLSLMVFLLLVAETMPPTSDALPLIGIYFACIMMMCSLSIIFTVIILNFHHRSPETHSNMPRWLKHIICGWLAWMLCMKRPNGSTSRKTLNQRAQVKDFKMAPLVEKSRSLMANALDIDDDPRMVNGNKAGFLLKVEETMTPPSLRSDVTSILRELKKITAKFRREDEESDVKNDWKFAAMVFDRLCLIICGVFTLASTVAILASAPHLMT